MPVDVSSITYFEPILAFLIVFVVMFAVLAKTKILGEDNKFVNIFVSFLIATIFVSAAGVTEYVLTITPWFAVLLISVLFILVLTGFVGQIDLVKKGTAVAALIVLGIVFLVSGYVVFSSYLNNPGVLRILDLISDSRVSGGIVLLVVALIVSWILAKAGGKK